MHRIPDLHLLSLCFLALSLICFRKLRGMILLLSGSPLFLVRTFPSSLHIELGSQTSSLPHVLHPKPYIISHLLTLLHLLPLLQPLLSLIFAFVTGCFHQALTRTNTEIPEQRVDAKDLQIFFLLLRRMWSCLGVLSSRRVAGFTALLKPPYCSVSLLR